MRHSEGREPDLVLLFETHRGGKVERVSAPLAAVSLRCRERHKEHDVMYG